MSMKSKYRSSYKRRFGKNYNSIFRISVSVILFCGVIGASTYLVLKLKTGDERNDKINNKTVYVAKEDIIRGHIITTSQLEEIHVTREMPDDYYCTSSCIDQIAAVDIPKGMLVLSNMLCTPDVEEGQREVECEIVSLSNNLVDNDYVDVRIMMPNGEDYIVLAKKSVHDLTRTEDNQQERCYLWMSEDEILYYSAAIVDAYLYPGSSLYTTRYIEPALQKPSITTYVPSIGTITMMKQNPNLVKEAVEHLKENKRKQLENRLTYYLNKDIREVLWSETDSLTQETLVNPAKQLEDVTVSNQQGVELISGKDKEKRDEAEQNPVAESQSVFVDDSNEKEVSGE